MSGVLAGGIAPVWVTDPDGPDGAPLLNVSSTMWVWGVMRCPENKTRRWWWSAVGPSNARGGFALSEAVARVRAQRALQQMRA